MEQIDYDIDDFMTYCEVKNLSKKTISSYEQTLRLFAMFLKRECNVKEAGDTKEIHIREYIKHLQERGKYTVVANENTKKINFPENRIDYKKEVSKTTINNYIRNIKVFFNYMYDNRYINNNPMRRVKQLKNQRKVVGYIDDLNMNKLFKCFDLSKFHEYRDYVIAQLIFDTGMRIGETLLLKETDIDFVKRTVLLRTDNTKGKKDRYVFFSAEMLKELKWLVNMIKIVEQEIKEYLKGFRKRDITMKLNGIIIAKIKIINVRCFYKRNVGILEIGNRQIKFEFNTSFYIKWELRKMEEH